MYDFTIQNNLKLCCMATIKIKFRPSKRVGEQGSIFYQVIHKKSIRQQKTIIANKKSHIEVWKLWYRFVQGVCCR